MRLPMLRSSMKLIVNPQPRGIVILDPLQDIPLHPSEYRLSAEFSTGFQRENACYFAVIRQQVNYRGCISLVQLGNYKPFKPCFNFVECCYLFVHESDKWVMHPSFRDNGVKEIIGSLTNKNGLEGIVFFTGRAQKLNVFSRVIPESRKENLQILPMYFSSISESTHKLTEMLVNLIQDTFILYQKKDWQTRRYIIDYT